MEREFLEASDRIDADDEGRASPSSIGSFVDGLRKRGFRLGTGVDGGGLMSLALRRSGGFYIDLGCSQLIVDGQNAAADRHGMLSRTRRVVGR
jgi:hypothetical protein